MNCVSCGHALAATAKFCNKCGVRQALSDGASQASPSYTTCPNCGHLCAHRAKFCERCGCQFSTLFSAQSQTMEANADQDAAVIVFGNVQDVPAGLGHEAAGFAPQPDKAFISGTRAWLTIAVVVALLAAGSWWWLSKSSTAKKGVDVAPAAAEPMAAVPVNSTLAPNESIDEHPAAVEPAASAAAETSTAAPQEPAAIVRGEDAGAPVASRRSGDAPPPRAAAKHPMRKKSLDDLLD